MTTISLNQKNNKKITKLHLGCGEVRIPGYINVDSRKTKATDIVHDIKNLNIFDKGSIEEIYACHVLEHFGRFEINDILTNWNNVLKAEGVLKISVPDFKSITDIYLETSNISLIEGPVIGGQTYANNFHYNIFDFQKLEKILIECGFYSIERYDWRKTVHAKIDDYSQAYIPHMQKDTGKLISLNIKCLKK